MVCSRSGGAPRARNSRDPRLSSTFQAKQSFSSCWFSTPISYYRNWHSKPTFLFLLSIHSLPWIFCLSTQCVFFSSNLVIGGYCTSDTSGVCPGSRTTIRTSVSSCPSECHLWIHGSHDSGRGMAAGCPVWTVFEMVADADTFHSRSRLLLSFGLQTKQTFEKWHRPFFPAQRSPKRNGRTARSPSSPVRHRRVVCSTPTNHGTPSTHPQLTHILTLTPQ